MSDLAFAQARQKYIGGSDIGAILGVSPFMTRWDLYQSKVVPIEEQNPNQAMRYGTALEPAIGGLIADDHPDWKFTFSPETVYHPDHKFLAYNADGVIQRPDDTILLEIKTARHSDDWGEPPHGAIPPTYNAQIQYGMGMLGIKECVVAASILGGYPVEYTVPFDEPYYSVIEEEALAFWETHVAPQNPPPLDDSYKLTEQLKAEHPHGQGMMPPEESPPHCAQLATLYADINDKIKALNREKYAIQNQFRALLGDYESVLTPHYKATWKNGAPTQKINYEGLISQLRHRYPELQEEIGVLEAEFAEVTPGKRTLRITPYK